jgi:SDR family mycofactocin-dependent oxidoreductase
MGRLEGKVAFITGGARGQGRSHAVLMAEEGADVITLDLCGPVGSVEYPPSTPEDLEETVRLVEKTGRRVVARQADVRDFDAVKEVVAAGMAELGRLDFVLANAGIMPTIPPRGEEPRAFYDAVEIMLTGVFHTCEAAIPHMIKQGQGGAIVITSSTAGLQDSAGYLMASSGYFGYTAAKHGVVGLMRAYANTLGPHRIRCNTVHPGGVNSPMIINEPFSRLVKERRSDGRHGHGYALPVESLDPSDISRAIIFLCSDDGQHITGVTLPVDAGMCNK